jgi:hypothetical protein
MPAFFSSFFDLKKRFHAIRAGMAAQERAEELFAVTMWQRRWKPSVFCIGGGSANVGIRSIGNAFWWTKNT